MGSKSLMGYNYLYVTKWGHCKLRVAISQSEYIWTFWPELLSANCRGPSLQSFILRLYTLLNHAGGKHCHSRRYLYSVLRIPCFLKRFFSFCLITCTETSIALTECYHTLTQTYIMLRECYRTHTNLYNADRLLSRSCKHMSLWKKPKTSSCTPIPCWKNTITTTDTYMLLWEYTTTHSHRPISCFLRMQMQYMLKQAHCPTAECYYTHRNTILSDRKLIHTHTTL